MKKIVALFLLIILTFSLVPIADAASYTPTFDIQSEIALLINLDTNTNLIEKNNAQKFNPQAFCKIVATIVAIENSENLDKEVTAPPEIFVELQGTNSATAGIQPKEVLTLRQLLYCVMLQSANEATNIVAYEIGGGDIEKFVTMMNDFVKRIGCTDTVFYNPHGLFDDGQTTTANDLAVICKYVIENPTFMEIANTTRYTIPSTNLVDQRVLVNTNYLLDKTQRKYYYEYAQGIKTSSGTDTNRSLVSIATKDSYTYLCVLAEAPYADFDSDGISDNFAMKETKLLYEWAFNNFVYKNIITTGETVCEVPVEAASEVDHVRLVPEAEIAALVPSDLDFSGVLIEPISESLPDSLIAPVAKGDVVGKASVKVAEFEIAVVNLVASETVERSTFLFVLMKLHDIVTSIWFKIFIGLILVLVIIYIVLVIIANKKRREIRRRATRLRTSGMEYQELKAYRSASPSSRSSRKRRNVSRKKKSRR